MNKKRTKIISFIPAKKNSQDLKNKNLKKLNNLSLFELAIILAKKSKNYIKDDLENSIIVYLQPTSPFRNNKHIDLAINIFIKKKLRSILSVTENKNFYKSLKKNKNVLSPFFNNQYVTNNRQNLNKIYSPNGAIYIFYASDFLKKKKLTFTKSGYYLMNRIESIDIDDKQDYELAKFLSKKYLKFKK